MNSFEPGLRVIRPAEVRLLTEIGFLACGAGNTESANQIFEGLRRACIGNSVALIGLAMSHMESGAPELATDLLRQHYDSIEPDDHDYKVFFALSLLASGRHSEADRILKSVLEMSDADCPAHRFGMALMNNYLRDNRVVNSPLKTASAFALRRIT